MLRRGQFLLTLLLTTVYLGQSLFLGALHVHPAEHPTCVHVHECHDHTHCDHTPSTRENSPAVDSRTVSEESIGRSQESARSLADSHADCVICQYLSQVVVIADVQRQTVAEQVVTLSYTHQPIFVETSPYSLPRPRSPPELGNLSVS